MPTPDYSFGLPQVGGSENDWGNILNQNWGKVDDLLSGDEPVNGIDIASGTIDGSAITGTIGATDNVVSLDPSTEVSGKVGTLTGEGSGNSIISGCDVDAERLGINGAVVEGTEAIASPGTTVTIDPAQGTVQWVNIAGGTSFTFRIALGQGGMSTTLIIDKSGSSPVNIVWQDSGGNQYIKWIGGGAPDLNIGANVIQFFTYDMGAGPVLVGAYAGIAG